MIDTSIFWPAFLLSIVVFWIVIVLRHDRREAAIQANWLARVAKKTPKSSLIAGSWSGSYDYRYTVDQDTIQPDRTFVAEFTHSDGLFAGQVKDSVGIADIEGVSEYPDVRFRKVYREPTAKNPERKPFLYRGRFTSASVVVGDWKVDAPSGRHVRGNWRMERAVSDSTLAAGANEA